MKKLNSRQITLIVALVVALATGLLALSYLKGQQKPEAKVEIVVPLKPVLLAAKDIPIHAKITADMITRTTKPENTIEPGALDDPKAAIGDVALIAIPMNSAITTSKVGTPGSIGITSRLKPGLRAMTIPVDMVKSVAGLIAPGDRVDVMSSVGRVGIHPPTTYTIIRGAMVLALNQEIESVPAPGASTSPAGPSAPSTVTLAVTPQQADLLTVADLNSTLRLTLRSPEERLSSLPVEPLQFNTADVPNPGPPAPSTPGPFLLPVPGLSASSGLNMPGAGRPTPNPVQVINGDTVAR